MKKKILLPILLLATMTLAGCTNPPAKSSEPAGTSTSEPAGTSDDTQYGVAIANKEALQGEWYANTTRDLDVTLTPAANPLTELGKNLTVTSSDPEVVAVTGLGLKSLKAGTATITVKYHEATDTVSVTILDNSAKAKYGVAHEGTAADPCTNEDALAVAKHEKYEGEVYYVKGIVDRFYYAPGTNANNGTAFYLKAATDGGEQFEIFKCFKEDGSQLSDDDIWVGGEATVYGAFTKYNSQYETSSAVFVSCTGEKPNPRQTLTKTFAEVLAVGNELRDGDSTWDYYKFQGYVTVKSGTDFYLTATKGEALTPGKSDEAHGSRDIKGTNAIELYKAGSVAELAAKLLEGAKVEVTMIVKNYHGTVENGVDLKDGDVTVVEAGQEWAVPEPTVAPRTLKEFIDGQDTKALAYNVTATVKSWKDASSAKDKYGNMVLTDGENDLVIYGASATATALAWDNSSAYAFKNPQDFLTNEVTAALNIGDTVTMKLIRADYNGAVQGTGIITKVVPAGAPVASLTIATSIAIGDKLIMSAEGEHAATDGTKTPFKKQFNGISDTSTKYGLAEDYAGDLPASDAGVLEVVAGSSTGTFALKYGEKYLTWKSGNSLDVQDAVDANASWSFTFADGKATIANSADAEGKRNLQYNSGSPRFATYASAQKPVTLWKIASEGGDPVDEDLVKSWTLEEIEATRTGSGWAADKDWGDAGKGFKFNKVGGVTLTYNSTAAQRVKLQLKIAVKYSNRSVTGFWAQSGEAETKTEVKLNGAVVKGNEPDFSGVTESTVDDNGKLSIPEWFDIIELDLVAGENTITISYVAGGYSYYLCGAQLYKAEPAPVEIAQPVGSFSGNAVSAADDSNIFTNIALANSKAFVEVGSLLKTTVDFTYDKSTGVVTIPLGDSFGNLTATYDAENNKLTKVAVDGAAAAMLKNNGTLELAAAAKFWDCEGTTEELRAIFQRRYRANGASSWTVDNNEDHTDRIVRDETNFISGQAAMSVRPYSGSGNAVGLNLVNDFETAVAYKNIGFWVYNSSDADISLRTWVYTAKGLTSAKEIGGLTAKANGWTYCRMGFDYGAIYNFNVSNWNGSANALVFDNIVLF